MVYVTSKGSDQPAHTHSHQSLCKSLECSMTINLQTEQHLEFLSLKGGCTGSSEAALDKCHIVGNHITALFLVTELAMRSAGSL